MYLKGLFKHDYIPRRSICQGRCWFSFSKYIGKPSSNSAGQFFAMGNPNGPMCRGSQKDDKEGLLVDWPKASSSDSFGSLFSSKTSQFNRSPIGIRIEGQRRLSAILWLNDYSKMACPRSHQDRRVSKQVISRHPAFSSQLPSPVGRALWLWGSKPDRYRFNGSRSEHGLSIGRDSSAQTLQWSQEARRLFDEARQRPSPRRPESRHEEGQRKGKILFLSSKECPRRETPGSLSRFFYHGQARDASCCRLMHSLESATLAQMPWNVRRAYDQIKDKAWRYLLDVAHFTRNHTIKAGKILSLHCSEVACIKKGKVGKENEFGRVFQLGRIKGNFLFVLNSTSIRMNDKESLVPMLAEHQVLFGEDTLTSLSTDKGYWSSKNLKAAAQYNIKDIGLQPPANIKRNKKLLPTPEIQEKLRDRRAGIEPLIAHVKHRGQLGKSRMKSDAATLAAGYASVLGFNIRQLIRHQGGKMKEAA